MKRIYFLFIIIALMTSCNSITDAIIEKNVIATNLQCPIAIGNGLSLTKVENDPLYVLYFYEGDSDLYSFSKDQVTDEMKQNVASELRSRALSDKAAKQFIDALKKLHKGVIYHYYTSSGTVMDVVIEPELL